jgi:hypothetical protein
MSIEAKFYRLTEKFQKREAEHEKSMSEVLKVTGENYARLEGQHHKNIIVMKEAEERARAEETKRAKAEAEIAKLREKMKELESECVRRLGDAHKEGMEEGLTKGEELGLTKGKELGREGAMGEVTAQFKMVYNSGFRHGWKLALSKTEQPEVSELFLRANTPLPYPDAGLKNSNDEGDEEDEEGEEEEGEEGTEEGGHNEEERKEGEGRKEEEKRKEKRRYARNRPTFGRWLERSDYRNRRRGWNDRTTA